MASRDQNESELYGTVSRGLRRWLEQARDVVMAPWRRYRMQPDPTAIYGTQDEWNAEVQTILTHLGRIAMSAWSQATDVPPVSRHAFVMAQLAQTENFLVRMPDETYNLVFAAITDVINGGGNVEAVADRVDDVLTWTGSENWPNRARVIAITETTRAMNAGVLGAGTEQARVTGRILRKEWRTEEDDRVRASHRAVNGEVRDFYMPFYVGGWPMMYPGDPAGPPEEVIGCRCDLLITNEEGR
jgi:uncharacterized protein with gpF-like domain